MKHFLICGLKNAQKGFYILTKMVLGKVAGVMKHEEMGLIGFSSHIKNTNYLTRIALSQKTNLVSLG